MIYFEADTPIEANNHRSPAYGSAGFFEAGIAESVDFTAQLDEDRQCEHCGETVAEYVDGWQHDNGETYCNADEAPENMDEEQQDEALDEYTNWEAWENGHNTATPAKQAPGNWVGFSIDPEHSETQVQVSVGDPRGCFTFRLWRSKDSETGEEELRLSMPYPGEGMPHMELEHLHDGVYRIK